MRPGDTSGQPAVNLRISDISSGVRRCLTRWLLAAILEPDNRSHVRFVLLALSSFSSGSPGRRSLSFGVCFSRLTNHDSRLLSHGHGKSNSF
jgi:hypothetical protein